MTLTTTLALALAVFVLGITPGPAVFAMVARALASGLWPAVAFNVGVIAGDLVLLSLAVLGLAAVAVTMGDLFIVVKIAGGMYLVWLGWKLWRAEPEAPHAADVIVDGQFRRNALGGFLLTLGNPKAIVFYAAFLPTFVDLANVTARDWGMMAAVVAVVLFSTNLLYALLAARARHFFKSRRAVRNLNRTAGTMMVGAGIAVATR
ncbi:MAG TPA: LysE family translocator [Alphaproteobacteria bacterium]